MKLIDLKNNTLFEEKLGTFSLILNQDDFLILWKILLFEFFKNIKKFTQHRVRIYHFEVNVNRHFSL